MCRAQIGKVHDCALADGQVECRSGQVDFHEITPRERNPIVQADHTRKPLGVVESSGCELDSVAPASVLFREQSRRAPKARSDVQHEPVRSESHSRRERSSGVCAAGVILVGRSTDCRFREVPRCQTVESGAFSLHAPQHGVSGQRMFGVNAFQAFAKSWVHRLRVWSVGVKLI